MKHTHTIYTLTRHQLHSSCFSFPSYVCCFDLLFSVFVFVLFPIVLLLLVQSIFNAYGLVLFHRCLCCQLIFCFDLPCFFVFVVFALSICSVVTIEKTVNVSLTVCWEPLTGCNTLALSFVTQRTHKTSNTSNVFFFFFSGSFLYWIYIDFINFYDTVFGHHCWESITTVNILIDARAVPSHMLLLQGLSPTTPMKKKLKKVKK